MQQRAPDCAVRLDFDFGQAYPQFRSSGMGPEDREARPRMQSSPCMVRGTAPSDPSEGRKAVFAREENAA